MKDGDLIEDIHWASKEIKENRCQLMNNEIVKRWNKVVKTDDTVYHLGDFSFKGIENAKKWEKKLHGKIIHFLGNHDRNSGVKSYILSAILDFGGKTVLTQHLPPVNRSEIPKGCDFVLCGHVHDKWKYNLIEGIPIINVGVDVWDFKPIDVEELIKYYWEIKNKAYV